MTPRIAPARGGRAVIPRLDVFIVLSPKAARTESTQSGALLREATAARGLRLRLIETGPKGPSAKGLERAVQRALDAGCRRFVAVGGDGTTALVAGLLHRSKRRGARPTLAIVPTGTANVLARELGIPMEIPAAVALALEGSRTIDLDAISTRDRLVFTQVGLGLDAQMIRTTTREAQIKQGRMAYARSFVRQASIHRSVIFRLDIDGTHVQVRALQIVVANAGALGAPPFTWGPGIDPSDGIIDVCVFTARTLRDHLMLVIGLLTGDHAHSPHTQYFKVARRVTISSRRPVLVQGDGELLGRTPVTLNVTRRAVRLCVPKNIEKLEATIGAPTDLPVPKAEVPAGEEVPLGSTPTSAAHAAEPAETLAEDVVSMVAQHSRTWVLQGWARHPLAFLQALDAALFLRINALHLGTVPDKALILLSQGMHYGEGWAVVAVILLIVDFKAGLRVIAEALPVLWATMLTVNFPLKWLFGRRRPFTSFVSARVRGPRPLDSSFPSGHTAAAFAGALLFGAHEPLWSPLFYALATAVGFSRIYLGVHYPGDVLIGAAAGTFLAGGYLALVRLAFSAWH